MTTPIGDSADYFKQRHRPANVPPSIDVSSSTAAESHYTPTHNDEGTSYPMSPESPESRRPQALNRRPPTAAFPSFDARNQWHRVVDRLKHQTDGGGIADSRSSSQQDIPRLGRRPRPLSRRQEIIDGSSNVAEDTSSGEEAYEMTTPQTNDDDALPSPHDLEMDRQPTLAEIDDSDRNYFKHPFQSKPEDEAKKSQAADGGAAPAVAAPSSSSSAAAPVPVPSSSTSSSSSSSSSSQASENEYRQREGKGFAHRQWMKTLDKVRLISNIHSLPNHPKEVESEVTTSLAPYYPPLFEPPFIALSYDNSKRKLPPILLGLLSVAVTDSESTTIFGITQLVFRVELQYGDIKWVIRKTMADFVALHYRLKVKSQFDYVPAPPPFPNQLQNIIQTARHGIGMDNEEELDGEERKKAALNRRKALTKYLKQLLQKAHMLVSYDICEFLEISAISIVQDMGWKGKEGYLENRVRFVSRHLCHTLKTQSWTREWVILRDSYIAFLADIASTSPTDVFLLDKSFQFSNQTPGIFGKYHHHITLQNRFRKITIKGSRRQVEEWMNGIRKVQQESPWVKTQRFNSFAPIRHNAKVKWFVDAEDHFNAVAEAILSAKSEIYIADWWLSPELYLRRPPAKNEEFRIDRLLQRKAREGVMIYIVVYKEMQVALTIDSAHTKQWLQSMHPNIIVQRSPDHRSIDNTVLFWSHHEKIVVVDNRLAFIGGLDLCYGRWDTHAHRLADYPADGHEYEMIPGQDYSNPRVKDFANVTQYDQTLVNREVTPRMPWHDVTIGVVGPIARDVARHFIQRWNFLKASKGMHRPSVPFLMPKGEYVAARDESKFKGSCRVQLLRSSAEWSSGIEREHSIYNAYMECISKAKHFIYIENQFFISATQQDKLLRNKIAQAMVERIKRAHQAGEKFKIFILIPLIPAFEGDLASSEGYSARNVMHFEYVSISRGGFSIVEKLQEAGINPSDYIGWYSLRNWDRLAPRDASKKSRDEMSKKADSGAQFREGDKSSSGSNRSDCNSIEDLTDEDPNHFVSELIYIHDKLLIVDDRLVIIGSANVNDRSMLGNRDSEVGMLIEDTDLIPSYMDGKEYKAAKFANTLRLQLWKEHLGLLDFTDWPKLLESNNEMPTNPFRDPGNGCLSSESPAADSEDVIKAIEADQPDQVLDHSRRSRRQDDKEEQRLLAAKALDPLLDHCYYNIWRKTADTNSVIYRELFQCVPDDTVHTFEQHRQFIPDTSSIPHGHIAKPDLTSKQILEKLSKIRGHLVMFPLDYLKDENMLGSSIRETVVPMVIFT